MSEQPSMSIANRFVFALVNALLFTIALLSFGTNWVIYGDETTMGGDLKQRGWFLFPNKKAKTGTKLPINSDDYETKYFNAFYWLYIVSLILIAISVLVAFVNFYASGFLMILSAIVLYASVNIFDAHVRNDKGYKPVVADTDYKADAGKSTNSYYFAKYLFIVLVLAGIGQVVGQYRFNSAVEAAGYK